MISEKPTYEELEQLVLELEKAESEREGAEEALRESEERFRRIYEHMAVGVAQVSLDFIIEGANEAYCKMLGYSEQELIGMHLKGITHPEVLEENLLKQSQLARGEIDHFRMEKRFVHKKGKVLHGILDANLVRNPEGQPLYFLGSVSNITELKHVEEALRESEEKYRLLVENANELVLVAQDGIIRFVNRKAFNLLGYTSEELLDKQFIDHIHPDDRKEVAKRHLRRLKGEDLPSVYFFRIFDKAGEVKWMQNNAVRIEWKGKPATLNFMVDMTEFKRIESEREKLQAQLIQAQKMESIGQLAGGIAHDFNNMLSVILGHTEIVLGKEGSASPIYKNLQEIHNAANRSAELTRQLLGFARKQTVAPRVLDLNETVEKMLKLIRRLIGEDIELAWIPGTAVLSVKVDPTQIDQILTNLCVNARDAIETVGKIIIETGNVVFDDEYCTNHLGFVPGKYVLLAVSDDGCGMDTETLNKIFEPFFTTKDVGRGTGLGLATVYGIVKQNNGFINVYSEPGKGTTAKIYLPVQEIKVEHNVKESPMESNKKNTETVLVVEDELAILEMITGMLEHQGYNVLASSAPVDAIRMAKEYDGDIHLLLADVIMPKMNGRDLSKRLIHLYPNIKSLFMSGYTANIIAQRGVLEEGVHFIQKPFSMQEIIGKIREVLENG